MIFPGSIILAVLETMSYESSLTIIGFPCCVTHRQELANGLVDLDLIEITRYGYQLTERGEQFLHNLQNHGKL
jgi:predicted transcriptional regulator